MSPRCHSRPRPPPTLSGVDDQLLRRILDGDDPAVLVAVALAAVDRPLGRAAAGAGWAAENDVGTLVVAETFGYLTALWTGLVLGALRARFAGRAFDALDGVAAALILMGGLSPLALPLVDLANFGGYVLWSAWLLIFAAVLVRRGAPHSSRA